MKNKSYIGIAFIILIFGIWAIPKIVDRFQNKDIVKNDRLNVAKTNQDKTDLVKIGAAPSFSFLNFKQQEISNKTLQNKVYLVEFFFTKCPTICPVMNKNMKVIDSTFANRKDFQIVSVTIDPENDSFEVLKKHAEELKASENWNFVRADKDYTFKIATKGFNLYAGQNDKVSGGFEHSGLFALVDKNGNIKSRTDDYANPIVYYDGLSNNAIQDLITDIKTLLN